MLTPPRSLTCSLLVVSALLAGCASGPEEHRRPSAARGGFSVLVDGPDHPAAARVVADIGAFAQARGFARQAAQPGPPVDPVTRESLPAAPERFRHADVELDISYQPTTHRVSAYLHSGGPRGDRKLIDGFYHDFDREYGGRYGTDDPISESGYSDESAGPLAPERPAGASVPGPGGGISAPGSPTGPGYH